jgi:hypothetical protein
MSYLEIKLGTGSSGRVALSANGLSLARSQGCLASLFGTQYPIATDYFSGLESEGWRLVTSSSSRTVGMINGMPFANDESVYTFSGNGRYEINWSSDGRWAFNGHPKSVPQSIKPTVNIVKDKPVSPPSWKRVHYFQKGDIVTCYSNGMYEESITVGCKYNVLGVIEDEDIPDDLIQIRNDRQRNDYIPSVKFLPDPRDIGDHPKFLIGEVVICRENFLSEENLTVGKTYIVQMVHKAYKSSEDLIDIIDDNQQLSRSAADFFAPTRNR